MRYLLIIFLVIISSGYIVAGQSSICEIARMKEFYSSQEIKVINEIVEYYDSIVVNNTSSEDFNIAYDRYLKMISIEMRAGNNDGYSQQKYLNYVIAKYDSILVNDIFVKVIPLRISIKDIIIENPVDWDGRAFNIKGRMYKYFNSLRDDYQYFNAVMDRCYEMGGISPTVIGYIFYSHEVFDFDDFNYRLWTIINLFLMQDSNYVKCEKYLEKYGG